MRVSWYRLSLSGATSVWYFPLPSVSIERVFNFASVTHLLTQ